MYTSNPNEIFTHAQLDLVSPPTLMPGFRGELATFSRAFFLFFFEPTSRQSLTVFPAQLLDLCPNFRKVVLQIFLFRITALDDLLFSVSSSSNCSGVLLLPLLHLWLYRVASVPASLWHWCVHPSSPWKPILQPSQ